MRCRGDLERCGDTPDPSRRDAAPTGSPRDFHGKASAASFLAAGTMIKAVLENPGRYENLNYDYDNECIRRLMISDA
jgi:hypothetical protein